MSRTARRSPPKSRSSAPRQSEVKVRIREHKESLIIEAAAKLFSEKGFQRTTLDDICAALGVTKPFVYTYFKSKDSILERLFEQVSDGVLESAG